GACNAASPSTANCMGVCGQALGSCQQSVSNDQTQCIADCRTASQKGGCVGTCHDVAADAREGCLDTATACRAACGGGTTTTSEPPATTSTSEPAGTTTSTSEPAETTTSTTLMGSPSGAFAE